MNIYLLPQRIAGIGDIDWECGEVSLEIGFKPFIEAIVPMAGIIGNWFWRSW